MAKQTTLTTKDLQAGFNVGHMTVYNWRLGSSTRDPLPVHIDASKRVTFKLAEIKAWAKKYQLDFKPAAELSVAAKPGPKAKKAAVKQLAKKTAKPAAKLKSKPTAKHDPAAPFAAG
jgi:hypothetical protein